MTTLHNDTINQATEAGDSARLTTWYAQGHSDGLGDRLLMFDNTSAPSWEILRFTPTLARNSRFQAAVLERVDQLRAFVHPAFPVVRSVGDLDGTGGLAVVSTYVTGVLLSEAAKKPRTAALALRMVQQLAPALAEFHDHSPGVTHGILTAGRIVLAAGGRLMVREHMVGSAVDALGLSADELWRTFGILCPPIRDAASARGGVGDITQLALVAMSLMAGRRIGPQVYPSGIVSWLDGIAQRESRHEPDSFPPFRRWLERALQIDQPFESARQASDMLAAWCGDAQRKEPVEGTLRQSGESARSERPPESTSLTRPDPPATLDLVRSDSSPETPSNRRGQLIRWAAIAAGVLAIGEAAVIGRLLYRGAAATPETAVVQPVNPPSQSGPGSASRLMAAMPATNGQEVTGVQRLAAAAAAVDRAVGTTTDTGDASRAGSSARAGLRVSSPIELQVLDGERLIGSSRDGAIIAPTGSREFEFVNSAIGYRARRTVDIKPGQITPVSVRIPNGRLNINAIPWAEVWIDGQPYGETPLGNVSIAPGEHVIRFRHPQLGERFEKTIVRSDVPARVSVNLNLQQ